MYVHVKAMAERSAMQAKRLRLRRTATEPTSEAISIQPVLREIRQLCEVQRQKLQQVWERLTEYSAALQQRDAKLLPRRETLRETAPSLTQSRSNDRSDSTEMREDFASASVIPVARSRAEFGPVVASVREEVTGGSENFASRFLFRGRRAQC